MSSGTYFVAGIIFAGLVVVSAFLIGSNESITGLAAKTTCSGGMAITDGYGNYCYMSSGSCDASCTSCAISVKVVDRKMFLQRCSSGR